MSRAAILMAGGAGTRLWPLSTDENPKQFLALFDGRSLLQLTFERLLPLVPPEAMFVSTNERYRGKVAEQLPALPPGNILVEPSRRNTAPAIALCMSQVRAQLGDDPVTGIFPSDQYVQDPAAFLAAVEKAWQAAEAEPFLLTIGIEPDHPNTGFGYLEVSDEEIAPSAVRLRRFVEKPDRARAEEFVRSGRFVWNGGMFVWRTSVFEEALRKSAPDIAGLVREIEAAGATWTAAYERMPSISIDYALMEKAPNVATVRGSFGWSDVGSWRAVASLIDSSPALHVHLEDSAGVLVRSDGRRPVAVIGLDDVAVIDAPDGLLVLKLDRSEALSAVVKKLKS